MTSLISRNSIFLHLNVAVIRLHLLKKTFQRSIKKLTHIMCTGALQMLYKELRIVRYLIDNLRIHTFYWCTMYTLYITRLMYVSVQGRIQEFWLGGRGFFFKDIGFGGHLKAPSGSRATPWWGPRGRSPRKLLNFSDFRSKISPHRWRYTLS